MDGTVLEKLAEIKEYALAKGVHKAELIPANRIVVDERVRFKCQVPFCPDFGHNLRCPPGTMSVAEFREVLSKYTFALLIQVKTDVAEEKALLETERNIQLLLGELERKALESGFYFAAGLGASCCRICPECVGARSGLACRNPRLARPSAEAMGIDVIRTAGQAGLPFSLNLAGEVIYTAFLLLD